MQMTPLLLPFLQKQNRIQPHDTWNHKEESDFKIDKVFDVHILKLLTVKNASLIMC